MYNAKLFAQISISLMVVLYALSCNHKDNDNEVICDRVKSIIIKFDLPKDSLNAVDSSLSYESGIFLKTAKKQYSLIDSLYLCCSVDINGTVRYFEASSENTTKNGMTYIAINNVLGDTSMIYSFPDCDLDNASRYKFEKNTLQVFKRCKRTGTTVMISYDLTRNRIYFTRDDGFTVW